jgi:hypothetical protein
MVSLTASKQGLPMTHKKQVSYELENGATVSVKNGYALDYSLMRASQLKGLLGAMLAPGFAGCASTVKDDCLWLAHSLATEIAPLFEIVAQQADTAKGGAA